MRGVVLALAVVPALFVCACFRSEDIAIGGPYAVDDAGAQPGADVVACVAGERRCEANSPATCSQDGTWITSSPCGAPSPFCEDGVCRSHGASCAGLPATCGPNGDTDCCASALVPGGTFLRNYDGATYTDNRYPATVGDFRLDRFEITVGRFRNFVSGYPGNLPAAGAGKNRLDPADPGWDASWNARMPGDQAALRGDLLCDANNAPRATWTDTVGANETRPIICISWAVALAFCIWDGGRLPTEAEWNYAAAGGAEQRVYPWSTPPTSTTIDLSRASYACRGDGDPACSFTDLLRVGALPAGNARWGHADMAGNAAEYVMDAFSDPLPMPCDNCASRADTTYRTHRGGDFEQDATLQVVGTRGEGYLHWAYPFGARCARDP